MKRILTGVLALSVCSVLLPTLASARPGYLAAFTTVYEVKPDSNLGKAKCGVCHVGADKKVRNTYGQALGKALGKEMASNDEITAAIKKVDKEKSADKKTTFGTLIKEDKLPGAEKK
jgi:hypothetical protein